MRRRQGQSKTERATLHQVHTPDCRKRGYVSRADAKKALRGHRGKGQSRGVRPYLCRVCDWWHLGHLPEPVLAGRVDKVGYFK